MSNVQSLVLSTFVHGSATHHKCDRAEFSPLTFTELAERGLVRAAVAADTAAPASKKAPRPLNKKAPEPENKAAPEPDNKAAPAPETPAGPAEPEPQGAADGLAPPVV